MKRIACLALLLCLLLTSCAAGGNDLNIYTTEPRPETTPPAVADAPDKEGNVTFETTAEPLEIKVPEIPEELREYVPGYTYDPSDDSGNETISRLAKNYAVFGNYMYYVFKDNGPNKGPAMLKCLNLTTGEVTTPCFDPVCTHDTADCDFAFYLISGVRRVGKYVVFWAMKNLKADVRNKAYLYDVTTGELREGVFDHEDYDNGTGFVTCIGDMIYTVASSRRDNPNSTGEHDRTLYKVDFLRYNIPADKWEVYFSSENTFDEYGFSMAYRGRLYYSQYDPATSQNKYYSMLPDGGDVREEPYYVSTRYYVGDLAWESVYDGNYHVQVTNIVSGEVKRVISSDQYELGFCVTDKHLYYTYIVKDETGKTSSQLWRCDHNGENQTQLITFDGNLRNFSIYGNYIYFSSANNNLCLKRIHVETGEVLIIE